MGKVFAVGGAANNLKILETLSSVLGCPVYKPSSGSSDDNKSKPDANSCSVGAAYKAVWSFRRYRGEEDLSYLEMLKERKGSDGGNVRVAEPEVKKWEIYGKRLEAWRRGEEEVLRKCLEGET